LICRASCSCVNPPDLRWRLSHSPKVTSTNAYSKIVSLLCRWVTPINFGYLVEWMCRTKYITQVTCLIFGIQP
jgi:hypothetical protein